MLQNVKNLGNTVKYLTFHLEIRDITAKFALQLEMTLYLLGVTPKQELLFPNVLYICKVKNIIYI
jgi:hypothetical protein